MQNNMLFDTASPKRPGLKACPTNADRTPNEYETPKGFQEEFSNAMVSSMEHPTPTQCYVMEQKENMTPELLCIKSISTKIWVLGI